MNADDEATLEIVAEAPTWLPLARLWKVTIVIDERRATLPWGRYAFGLAPGSHHVLVRMGGNRIAQRRVELVAGGTLRLRYRCGLIKYLPGRLDVDVPSARVVTQ